jgi:type I restriction enzyme S subunit
MKNVETKNYEKIEYNFDNLLSQKKYRISDLGKVVTGRTPPSSKPQCFGDKYPFITPSDMDGRKKADLTERYLSDDGANLLKSSLLPAESVSVSCIGWQMGKSIMTSRPSFTNQQLNTIIPNDKVDADFLYYSLSTRRKELLSLGATTGVRTPILNKSAFSDLEVSLPNIVEQRKIAAILSAYDDLIENNTRRIKILEEMAQTLYREWFVKFRFPGHEKVKMVGSELGMVPEGWEVKRLGDVCNIVMGQSPKSEFYNDIGEGLPFHQGVTDFGDRFPKDRKYCTVINRIAEAGDILFSVRAPVGRINISDKKIVIGRGLCAIRSKSGKQAYILLQLNKQFEEEDTMGSGTIFKSVTKADMNGIKLIIPKEELLKNFEEIMVPFFAELKNLTFKNQNLNLTRDVLLPKLISGELNVTKSFSEIKGC